MLKDKYVLGTKIEKYLNNIGGDRGRVDEVVGNLKEKYNLPQEISRGIIYGNRFLGDYNELICYWITSEIAPSLVTEFFTNTEIKNFPTQRYEDDDNILPLKIPALQLADDQWIATISIQEMMKLRKASLIHYNADTQRALRVLVKGEDVMLVPFVNPNAVRKMTELFEAGKFIPNVITFNINQDDENAEFTYRNGVLEINNITAFDIVDGYNRFKMFERVYDKNPSVEFTSGLMIVNFSVSKAKQFIHQEDQKTHMRRIDSDSYNQADNYNIIMERVNNDINCNLQGEINNGNGLIQFSVAVRSLKCGMNEQQLTQKDVVRNKVAIVEKLNCITDQKIELLERKWFDYEIGIIFFYIMTKSDKEILMLLQRLSSNKEAQTEIAKAIRQKKSKRQLRAVLEKYEEVQ